MWLIDNVQLRSYKLSHYQFKKVKDKANIWKISHHNLKLRWSASVHNIYAEDKDCPKTFILLHSYSVQLAKFPCQCRKNKFYLGSKFKKVLSYVHRTKNIRKVLFCSYNKKLHFCTTTIIIFGRTKFLWQAVMFIDFKYTGPNQVAT